MNCKTIKFFLPAIINVSVTFYKATVTVVDIDSSAEDKLVATSPGTSTGLNLEKNQTIYFGGLPTIGNYRYTHTTVFI